MAKTAILTPRLTALGIGEHPTARLTALLDVDEGYRHRCYRIEHVHLYAERARGGEPEIDPREITQSSDTS